MLKVMGICFIVAGTAGFGRYFSSYLKMHLEQLVECREIFTQMDAGREYLRLPYAQLLKRTAKGKQEIISQILIEVADEMEKNTQGDATSLWDAAFQKRKKQLLLKEEEKVKIVCEVRKELEAPVKAGMSVGSVKYYLGEEVVKGYPIVVKKDVERITMIVKGAI